ncbi:ferritin-like domain-containing protein [Desulfobacula toluolica]|uniref:Rbr5: rubrerythrin n=1 Tax=Desulfobacula toluolica (strain DSM 7467 / Tol2) TaxID=651182 RepID=K0NJ52_DESTT|nr:ferritin family protein [Desulfobacula toluolica]CCK79903.1 Rbr5: rubrerythrin [Desulfobacula toluolica Tol2]
MPNEFNANEIFEIAIKIEQNGAIFYRDAAKQIKEENHKEFLLELAKMEDEHEATFATMQKDLQDEEKTSTTFDPDDETVLYLKALADIRVFFEKDQPDNSFKGILNSAIQAEKDSIAFYLGMKELVPAKLGQSKIDAIIKEEMSHIRLLAGKLTK